MYLNGTLVINASDAAYASGYVGVNALNGTATFQNLTIGA